MLQALWWFVLFDEGQVSSRFAVSESRMVQVCLNLIRSGDVLLCMKDRASDRPSVKGCGRILKKNFTELLCSYDLLENRCIRRSGSRCCTVTTLNHD